MREITHFIDGKAFRQVEGDSGDVFDPNTGEVQAKVARIDAFSKPGKAHQIEDAVQHSGLFDGAVNLLAWPPPQLAHGNIAHRPRHRRPDRSPRRPSCRPFPRAG